MNIKLCKKCPFRPYLVIDDFLKKGTKSIKYIIICEDHTFIRANVTAEITKETFALFLKDLRKNGYEFEKKEDINMISLLNIKDKNLFCNIEVNNLCLYYLENEISFLNKNNSGLF